MICASGLDRERSRTVWTLSGVEGVPAGHIVHFILDAVEQLPITDFRVNDRGSGSEQYPPRMMLALLIYCYATGRFGSRTIEAASYSDVAVRYLCANHHPDHDSICTPNLSPVENPDRRTTAALSSSSSFFTRDAGASCLTHCYAQVRPKWRQPFD